MRAKKGIVLLYKDLCDEWYDLITHSDVRTLGLHTLYRYGGMQTYLEWVESNAARREIERYETAGVTVEHELHAVDYLLPRTLFSARPELFRMNKDGQRTADLNFCASNADALAIISESAYQVAKTLRQTSHRYYLWRDDNLDGNCYCTFCGNLSGADQSIITMRAVLRGLRAYDNKASLSFLAYQDSLGIPASTAEDGLFLEFAPIERNHALPMAADDPANAKNRDLLTALLERFPAGQTRILEYFLDVSRYCQWKPEDAGALPDDADRIRDDVAFYDSLGVESITTFAAFINADWMHKYGTRALHAYLDL